MGLDQYDPVRITVKKHIYSVSPIDSMDGHLLTIQLKEYCYCTWLEKKFKKEKK